MSKLMWHCLWKWLFQDSSICPKLILPQQLPPPSQDLLKDSELLALRTCEGGGGRHSLPVHGLAYFSVLPYFSVTACLNVYGCSWERRASFPQDTAGGVRKGDRRRSCKKHSHPSLLPHPTLLAGRSRESISCCGYCLYGLLQSGCSHVQTTAAHWFAALGARLCSC